VIYYDFFKNSAEINEKAKNTVTVTKPLSKTAWGLFNRFWKVQQLENSDL